MVDIARPQAARRRRIRQALYVTAGITLIAIVTYGVTRPKPAAPGVQLGTLYTDTVKRGQMLRQVRGPGTLVPQVVRVIAAPVEGRVERIHVLAGEQVTAGTLLVELSNPELRQAEVDSSYQVKAAEAELNNIRVRLESERMSQQAAAATIQSDYNIARLQLDADEKLSAEGLIPALSVRLSRVRVEELGNRLRIEQQRLAIRKDTTEAQLAAQQARIEQLRALSRLNQGQCILRVWRDERRAAASLGRGRAADRPGGQHRARRRPDDAQSRAANPRSSGQRCAARTIR